MKALGFNHLSVGAKHVEESVRFYKRVFGMERISTYLRDPGGNLLEVDWPDVTTLEISRIPHLKKLAEFADQESEALRASLYCDRSQMRARVNATT